jgi:hypothetical protein
VATLRAGPVVISTISELHDLITSANNSRGRRRIELRLPGLTPLTRSSFEAELPRLVAACGCAEGAVGGLLGLSAALSLASTQTAGPLPIVAGSAIAYAALGFCVGVIVGKLAGLALARRRLRRMVAELALIAKAAGGATPNA